MLHSSTIKCLGILPLMRSSMSLGIENVGVKLQQPLLDTFMDLGLQFRAKK
jgi:hypothetical protein